MPITIQYQWKDPPAKVNAFLAEERKRRGEDPSSVSQESNRPPVMTPVVRNVQGNQPSSLQPVVAVFPLQSRPDSLLVSDLPKPEFEGCHFLEAKYPHPLDSTIRFEDQGHVYWVKWTHSSTEFSKERAISVSKLVEEYLEHFVREKALANMKKDAHQRHLKPRYLGMDDSQVCQSWDTACEHGKLVHYVLECRLNGLDWHAYLHFRVVQHFIQFWKEWVEKNGLQPFRTEWKMRSKPCMRLTGTLDALFVAINHPPPEECDGILCVWMIDYKFTPLIRTTGFQRAKGICQLMPDCNGTKYCLQQVNYAALLENVYTHMQYNGHVYSKMKVVYMGLLQLHDSLPTYILHNVDGLVECFSLPFLRTMVELMWIRRAAEVHRQTLASAVPHLNS